MNYPKYEALRKFAEKMLIECNHEIGIEVRNVNAILNRFINNPYDLIGMNVFVKNNNVNEYILDQIADDEFDRFVMEQEAQLNSEEIDDEVMDDSIFNFMDSEITKPKYLLSIDSWGLSRGNYTDPISLIEKDVNEFYIKKLSELYSEDFKDIAMDNEFVKLFTETLVLIVDSYYHICGVDSSVEYGDEFYGIVSFLELICNSVIDIEGLVRTNYKNFCFNFKALNNPNEAKANPFENFEEFLDGVNSVDDILNNNNLFRNDEKDNT